MHEYMGTELALTQQFMQHLYNPRLYPLEVGRNWSQDKYQKTTCTARRNRKKLVNALKKAPKGPTPGLGPLGQGVQPST